MAITQDDVLHIAELAKLELAPDQVEPLMRDLARILDYVERLGELDTSSVPPTAHVAVDVAPLRADVRGKGLSPEEALSQAARTSEGAFAVPAFVDEG